MRTGRPKQPLIVTEEERERLESLAHRARSQALLARRARVVLACAEGLDNKSGGEEVALLVGHGGQVAVPISEDSPGRAIRRAATRSATQSQR